MSGQRKGDYDIHQENADKMMAQEAAE